MINEFPLLLFVNCKHMAPSNRLVVVRMDEEQRPIEPDSAPGDMLAKAKQLKTTLRHRDGIFNGQRVEYFKGRSLE